MALVKPAELPLPRTAQTRVCVSNHWSCIIGLEKVVEDLGDRSLNQTFPDCYHCIFGFIRSTQHHSQTPDLLPVANFSSLRLSKIYNTDADLKLQQKYWSSVFGLKCTVTQHHALRLGNSRKGESPPPRFDSGKGPEIRLPLPQRVDITS